MRRARYDRERRPERARPTPQETARTRAAPRYGRLLWKLARRGRNLAGSLRTRCMGGIRVLLYRRRGKEIRLDVKVPLEKAGLGGRMMVRVQRGEVCGRCRGRRGGACPACYGTGRIAEEYLVPVEVPAGTEEGATLSVKGEGEPGLWGGRDGDLIVMVQIEPHRFFEPRGTDVHVEVPIGVGQAILGSRIRVRTLEGKRAELRIPSGTQFGTVFRLKGMGIRRNGSRGDQLVRVRVVIPEDITERQRELIEAFQSSQG